MTKMKLAYYSFWKGVRDYLESLKESEKAKPRKDIKDEKLFLDFMNWLNEKYPENSFKRKSMIELRSEFLKE
jgi:tRNA splicing ligase